MELSQLPSLITYKNCVAILIYTYLPLEYDEYFTTTHVLG